MTHFNNANTLEELRKQYKSLLKMYHPDTENGSTEITQQINDEYNYLFSLLKAQHTTEESNCNKESFSEMKWNEAEDEKLRTILSQIINFSDINIEIIGQWIWVSGDTYQHKSKLKALGFKFAGNKKMWYWHSEQFRKKSRKKLNINDIRNYYGSTGILSEQVQFLEA